MNKTKIGIFLSLMLVLGFCSSCGEKKANSKLLLNEVLVNNESNFQDDYGVHSAWIEIFNKSYGSADLAGCYLKFSSQPGDTATYFIPKGDVLTLVKPRQHALFWADGEPNRGTFHTNFKLDSLNANWIGLYDSGKKLLDQIVVPAGVLKANQSYARVSDATPEWEVKGETSDKYVTPSTNNQTIDSNAKMEKFEQHDSVGIGMSISAMSVVFFGLILLYISFKIVGKISVNLSKRNAMRAKGITDKKEAKEKLLGEAPGEVFAAISLALHEMQSDVQPVIVLYIGPELDEILVVLGAASLVGLERSRINGVCRVHADTALEAGCGLLTEQTLHFYLFDQVIGGLVQMGKAIYLLAGQVGGRGHQIFILRVLCKLVSRGKGVKRRTHDRIVHDVLDLLAEAVQIEVQLSQGFDVLVFCHHKDSFFLIPEQISLHFHVGIIFGNTPVGKS